MKGIWKNSEVKELFSIVEDYKGNNRSLKDAFISHAQKYGRKPNSVRNYYYHEVDNLKSDEKRLEKLGIDLSLHNKSSITYFSQEEEEKLMKDVDDMVKKGVSVRKACLSLSGGDVSQMLRYQNKYRNYILKNKPPKEEKNNVITFKKTPRTLTDGEVQSLFMGLVRLVKKNAYEESENLYRDKLNKANDELRKLLTRLSSQERDFEKLKIEIKELKNENSALENKMFELRCKYAEDLNKKV